MPWATRPFQSINDLQRPTAESTGECLHYKNIAQLQTYRTSLFQQRVQRGSFAARSRPHEERRSTSRHASYLLSSSSGDTMQMSLPDSHRVRTWRIWQASRQAQRNPQPHPGPARDTLTPAKKSTMNAVLLQDRQHIGRL